MAVPHVAGAPALVLDARPDLSAGAGGRRAFGGTTYFWPVTEPLGGYGVSVY
jgi:hypothetical protein